MREHSYLNVALTNGTSIVALRYTSNPDVQPASLYYALGRRYNAEVEGCIVEPAPEGKRPVMVLIASEPITARRTDWIKVERNAMMIVDETLRIRFESVELPFERIFFDYEHDEEFDDAAPRTP